MKRRKRRAKAGPTPWQVQVLGDRQLLGVMPLFEALALAKRLNRDLLEIASDANPPIWRLMPKPNSN